MLAETIETLHIDLAGGAAVPTDITCTQFACVWIVLLALRNIIAPSEVVALDGTWSYFVSALGTLG